MVVPRAGDMILIYIHIYGVDFYGVWVWVGRLLGGVSLEYRGNVWSSRRLDFE